MLVRAAPGPPDQRAAGLGGSGGTSALPREFRRSERQLRRRRTRVPYVRRGGSEIEPRLGTREEVGATDEAGYLVVGADDFEELRHPAD
jgi:hypothetical protein